MPRRSAARAKRRLIANLRCPLGSPLSDGTGSPPWVTQRRPLLLAPSVHGRIYPAFPRWRVAHGAFPLTLHRFLSPLLYRLFFRPGVDAATREVTVIKPENRAFFLPLLPKVVTWFFFFVRGNELSLEIWSQTAAPLQSVAQKLPWRERRRWAAWNSLWRLFTGSRKQKKATLRRESQSGNDISYLS